MGDDLWWVKTNQCDLGLSQKCIWVHVVLAGTEPGWLGRTLPGSTKLSTVRVSEPLGINFIIERLSRAIGPNGGKDVQVRNLSWQHLHRT